MAALRGTGRTPWIVARNTPGELACERCGDRYLPTLPCSFNIYIAICKAFCRDHRSCKPKPRHEHSGEVTIDRATGIETCDDCDPVLELERHRVGQ